MLSAEDTIRRNPEVVAQETLHGVILMRLGDGESFEINRVGALFWASIERPKRFSGICDEIATYFEIDGEVLRRDLEELVASLVRADLIEVIGPGR